MAYAEDIISNIDGPILREQRRVVLHLLDRTNLNLTDDQTESLEGLMCLLDEIADCCNDIYGKDCLFEDPELERKVEELEYEQRTQTYNH